MTGADTGFLKRGGFMSDLIQIMGVGGGGGGEEGVGCCPLQAQYEKWGRNLILQVYKNIL